MKNFIEGLNKKIMNIPIGAPIVSKIIWLVNYGSEIYLKTLSTSFYKITNYCLKRAVKPEIIRE
jgi:hypothetical protein